MAAALAVTTDAADPTKMTAKLTVTGAPDQISWTFGDCTDHPVGAAAGESHLYSGAGTFKIIGTIRQTGQTLTATVTTPLP